MIVEEIYRKEIKKFSWLKKINASLVKAENVVKDPKNPITKKYSTTEEDVSSWLATKAPINKHPIIFTTRVPKGNPIKEAYDKKDEARCREIAPSPPPKPIIK